MEDHMRAFEVTVLTDLGPQVFVEIAPSIEAAVASAAVRVACVDRIGRFGFAQIAEVSLIGELGELWQERESRQPSTH